MYIMYNNSGKYCVVGRHLMINIFSVNKILNKICKSQDWSV